MNYKQGKGELEVAIFDVTEIVQTIESKATTT